MAESNQREMGDSRQGYQAFIFPGVAGLEQVECKLCHRVARNAQRMKCRYKCLFCEVCLKQRTKQFSVCMCGDIFVEDVFWVDDLDTRKHVDNLPAKCIHCKFTGKLSAVVKHYHEQCPNRSGQSFAAFDARSPKAPNAGEKHVSSPMAMHSAGRRSISVGSDSSKLSKRQQRKKAAEAKRAGKPVPIEFAKNDFYRRNDRTPTQCNQCRDTFPANNLESHLKVKCRFRLVNCPQCRIEYEYWHLEEHMKNRCDHRLSECLYCHEEMTAIKIARHEEECPEIPIQCRFSDSLPEHYERNIRDSRTAASWCEHKIKRRNVAKHERENRVLHNELLLQSASRVDDLDDFLYSMTKFMESLERERFG